jgi:hypothetical protein
LYENVKKSFRTGYDRKKLLYGRRSCIKWEEKLKLIQENMFYYMGGRVSINERPDGTEGGDQREC